MGVAVHPRRRTVRSRRCDFNKKNLKTLKLSLYDQIPSKKLKNNNAILSEKFEKKKQNNKNPFQEIIAGSAEKKNNNQGKISKGKNHSKKITNPRIFMKTTSSSDFFQYQNTNYHSDPTRNQTSLKSCISTFSSVLE